MSQFTVTEATEADIPSLSTIVPRAFFKSNEFFRNTCPDTTLIRTWWSAVFRDAIHDSTYRVLVVHSDSSEVIGMILLRRVDATADLNAREAKTGVFARHPPCADHDEARYWAMLQADDGSYAKHMWGRAHYTIDLFGVDDKYQGTGLGKVVLGKACEIADEAGVEVWVTANLTAKSFYGRKSFKEVGRVVFDGRDGYGEAFLVYGDGKRG